jgi:F0F1-type ATP synthase membrane subunit c/vacuolar-type H+-ATPase subunit K
MSDLTASAELSARVRTMQIILSALAAGIAFFAIVVLLVRQGGNFQPSATPILTYTQVGFSILLLIAHLVVPNLLVASGRKKISIGTGKASSVSTVVSDLDDQERRLCELFQNQMIIGAALLEAAVFALLIAFLIEGEWACLVIAGLFLIRIVSLFPSRTRVERWIETQLDLIGPGP